VFRAVEERAAVTRKVLTDNKIDFAIVNGDVSKNDRDQIFHDFQNTNKIQVLLAHP